MSFVFARLAIIAILLFSASSIEAATLYIDPGTSSLYRGDSATYAVRLMPNEAEGECINVVDAVITYTSNIQPVDVSIGRSIFTTWVQPPTIDPEARTISFAGGIPNGYCGRVEGDPGLTNIIVEIVVRSPGFMIGASDDGYEAILAFAPETSAYLNDGQGTKAALTTLPVSITLEKTPGPELKDEWRSVVQSDNEPPLEFSVSLERDPVAFNNQYFIVFSTTDKLTGISHYEVLEEPLKEFPNFNWGRADLPWVRAESPYIVRDQTLNSIIRVRAYDKAGNEYIATLIPQESMRTTPLLLIVTGIGIIILLILALFVSYVIYRRRCRKRNLQEEDEQAIIDA